MPRLSIFCALASALLAQQPQQPVVPHIGYVYPAGGRQDTSVEVSVGGQFLNGAADAYVTGSGVQASVLKYIRPLTPAQANQLREQMQQLNDRKSKGPLTAEEEKTLAGIREQLAEFVRRPSSPAIAETAIVLVRIARDAPLGQRELRLGTANGLTNPLIFSIGQLPEFSRKPAKVPPAFAVVNGATPPNRVLAAQPEPPAEIALPAVLNGQMMPGAIDRYRFPARQGQRLVISAAARELVPYLSDAVPGWFQAALTLRGPSGKEVASAGHYRFHPDPVLFYEVPADGAYLLEIHDSIFRGREDFVYRVSLGELPFLASVFPLGAKAGTRASIAAEGWNLPAPRVPAPANAKTTGIYYVSAQNGAYVSNRVPFSLDTLPETLARDSNHRREKAQSLKLPVIVNGRIAHPGESAFFRFDGRPGDDIVAEVFARRLDSPLDSVLRLTDSAGRELALNDDCEDRAAGLLTHQADSRIAFRLPARGTFYLELADTQHHGGPEFAYRLRIARPDPDFELRVVPSSVNVRAGGSTPVTVYALRRDGFTGDIALKLKNAPSGFALSGATIPAGQSSVRLTLNAPTRRDQPFSLELEGQAQIGGKAVHHIAIPAEDMMQAFAYHHLVAQTEWMVRILPAAPARLPARAGASTSVRLPPGGSTSIPLLVPPRIADQVLLALNAPPEGVSIESVTPTRDGVTVVLHADAKIKPGIRGNLILDAFIERPAPAAGPTAKRRQLLGTLPAIPFEIVASTATAP